MKVDDGLWKRGRQQLVWYRFKAGWTSVAGGDSRCDGVCWLRRTWNTFELNKQWEWIEIQTPLPLIWPLTWVQRASSPHNFLHTPSVRPHMPPSEANAMVLGFLKPIRIASHTMLASHTPCITFFFLISLFFFHLYLFLIYFFS